MKNKHQALLQRLSVVGCITKSSDVMDIHMTPLDRIDILELRLDLWPHSFDEKPTQELIGLGKPLIITARDAGEGGCRPDWTETDRANLYFRYLPYATFIDIEASCAEKLGYVISDAKKMGVGVIISYHNIVETPSYAEIICQAETCRRFDGDVLKIAVRVETLGDLVELEDSISTIGGNPKFKFKVASMDIGEHYGKISRFLDAITGGPFIYGYIGNSTVTGQPKAVDVRRLLGELQ